MDAYYVRYRGLTVARFLDLVSAEKKVHELDPNNCGSAYWVGTWFDSYEDAYSYVYGGEQLSLF